MFIRSRSPDSQARFLSGFVSFQGFMGRKISALLPGAEFARGVRLRSTGADFSFASSDFKALGAFFCASCFPQAPLRVISGISIGYAESKPKSFLQLSRGLSAGAGNRQLRARVPHLVGPRLPSPYHFPARIQFFQAFAAPFPATSVLPSASRRAIPATETPRHNRSTIGSAVSSERRRRNGLGITQIASFQTVVLHAGLETPRHRRGSGTPEELKKHRNTHPVFPK
jgi:hypothetical protein